MYCMYNVRIIVDRLFYLLCKNLSKYSPGKIIQKSSLSFLNDRDYFPGLESFPSLLQGCIDYYLQSSKTLPQASSSRDYYPGLETLFIAVAAYV